MTETKKLIEPRELIRVENQKGIIENSVNQFAHQMKRELLKHLDRPGWKREKVEYLLARLTIELNELATAIMNNLERDEIKAECADVANFAMMISDIYKEG